MTRTATSFVIAAVCGLAMTAASTGRSDDPLPSWNDGATKSAIIDFVTRVSTSGGRDFVAPEDRIATFDNDGTLWAEVPTAEVVFAMGRVREAIRANPALGQRQPYKALLAKDLAYFKRAGDAAVVELLGTSHALVTQDQFDSASTQFLTTAKHPTLGVPYPQTAYKPMVELLQYLRANGFQTWICTGGTTDFVRAMSQSAYGIPPQQVIGTRLKEQFTQRGGRPVIWRLPGVAHVNDKDGKPVGIADYIGKRPVFAAGNERSGGDISMLRYSKSRTGPSFQLLVNHDDGEREFAYKEPTDTSLKAARAYGFTVVSIKSDWREVFGPGIVRAAADTAKH